MAVVANVAINVDSRGAPAKLKQVADRSKQVEQAVRDMNGRLRDSRGRFVAAGNSASKASSGFGNLAKGALKLAAAYATLNAAQSAVSAGIQRIESERRIQFLAKQYGEVDQLARAAANASDRFGQSQTSANRAIADVYARLRPVGVSLENIVSVYNGFNTAARISGSTAVEAENAFRQLSQALGSGALRGDEFNSIAEQVPGILTAISQETGVAQGKLREYAADGKITADVVIGALQRIEKDGADQLAQALGGPEQAIKDFQNASEDVQVALTTAIVPEMARAFRDLAAIIVGLEPAIRYIGGLIADTLGSFRILVESIRGGPVVERLRQGGQLGFNVGQEKEQLRSFFGKERFKQLEQQAREISDATMTPFAEALGERLRVAIKVADRAKEIEARQATRIPTRPFKVGDVIDKSTVAGGKVGGGGGAAAKDAQRAADEAKRIQERISGLQQDVALNEKLRGIREKIAEADLASDQALAVKLQGEERLLQLVDSYDRLKANAANNAEREALEAKLQSEALLVQQNVLTQLNKLDSDKAKALEDQLRPLQEQRRLLEAQLNGRREEEELIIKIENATRGLAPAETQRVENLIRGNAALEEQLNQVDLLNQALSGAGDIIGNQLRGAIDGLIDGTADWNNMLNNTLKQLASFFLNFGLDALTGGLAGKDGVGVFSKLFGGGRATGGPVNRGTAYMVGERGPELFVPRSSGSIVANDNLPGNNVNVVVNVDAKGTDVQGNDKNATQLGRVLSAAVQSELIKQQRPGGILAR